MKLILSTYTALIFKRKTFLLKNRISYITPTSNNSQTNVRNVVKICIQAIRAMNFTISLPNLLVYIEKTFKLGNDPPASRRTRKEKF